MAKGLGVDDQTVRSTVGRMQKSGFLKAWSVSLNPHALGMECRSVLLTAGERASPKSKVISRLRDVEGVVAIFSFLDDPGLRLVFYHEDDDELERRTRLISSICGVDRPYASWVIPFPPCRLKLRKTDWQIIRYLLKDSRKSVSEIAKGVGVSTRTVGRRLALMTEDNCFFPNLVVDAKKVDGFLYHFVISYFNRKDKATADELMRRSIGGIVFADTNAELFTVMAAICQNISEANKIADWLKAQEGTREVTARIFEDIIPVTDWIDHEMKKRQGA